MAWCSCQSSCPWWALQLRWHQLTMQAAFPHLLPNPLFLRPWLTMVTTRAITTNGQLVNRHFLSHQTQSITLRWPLHQGSEKRITSIVTGVHTLHRTPTFHLLHLTSCWRPARTPASPSSRYMITLTGYVQVCSNSCVFLKVNYENVCVAGGEATQRRFNKHWWEDRTIKWDFTQCTVSGYMLGWKQVGAAGGPPEVPGSAQPTLTQWQSTLPWEDLSKRTQASEQQRASTKQD